MFKVINLSLGNIKIGEEQTVYFPYEGIHTIHSMVSSCDCSVPVNEKNKSQIMVKYTPKGVPKHLTQKGVHEYTVKKIVTVVYSTQEQIAKKQTILLSFTAKISK